MLDHTVEPGGRAARGAAIYGALTEVERLAALTSRAPRLSDRLAVAEALGERYERLRAERAAAGDEFPVALIEKAAVPIDDATQRTEPADWWEALAAVALCAPLADELVAALRAGSGDEPADDTADEPVPVPAWAARRLRAAAELDPVLEARLALWSRRLVGESVVLAREFAGDDFPAVAERLVRSHAERLVALGLAD